MTKIRPLMRCPLAPCVEKRLGIVQEPIFSTAFESEIHRLSNEAFNGPTANRHVLCATHGIIQTSIHQVCLKRLQRRPRLRAKDVFEFVNKCLGLPAFELPAPFLAPRLPRLPLAERGLADRIQMLHGMTEV